MPNDGGRMAHVLALIAAGRGDRLLLSHDIAYKTSLVKYGGYGYHHLLVNVVPRLRAKGVEDRVSIEHGNFFESVRFVSAVSSSSVLPALGFTRCFVPISAKPPRSR
jgi:hypothetical protein